MQCLWGGEARPRKALVMFKNILKYFKSEFENLNSLIRPSERTCLFWCCVMTSVGPANQSGSTRESLARSPRGRWSSRPRRRQRQWVLRIGTWNVTALKNKLVVDSAGELASNLRDSDTGGGSHRMEKIDHLSQLATRKDNASTIMNE